MTDSRSADSREARGPSAVAGDPGQPPAGRPVSAAEPGPFYRFDRPGTLHRPGPIGRLVRLALGLPLLFLVWRLLFFAEIGDLRQIPFWSWVLIAWWLFPAVVNIGFGVSWGNWRPRVAVLAGAGAAALVGLATRGTWDAPPLWWFLLPWMIYVAGHLGASFVLAATLGTPGCEMRAIPHLIGLATGRPRAEHYCPGFLDGLDRWEALRGGARQGADH